MEATVRRPLAALILAAGVSSRMERFKPMLPVGEDTMIRRTVRMMQQAGADPIVVVTGYKSDVLRQHLDGMGLVFLNNEHYASTQMFDSFKIGLEYLLSRCERLLFSPGDVPTVQIDTVRRLLEYDSQVVRPVYGKKSGHPIVLRHDALEKISDYRGEDGLRGALCELGLSRQDVPVNDEGVVLDADTPEEYNRLLLHNLRVGGGQESLRLDLQLHLCALDSVFNPFFAQLLEMVRMTGSLQMACHAVHDAAEGGVLTVQMGRVLVHDEELAAGAVRRLGAGHGQHAPGVAQVVVEAVGLELALDAVARAAHAVAVGAAALDHKAGNDPVEDQAVVEAGIGQRDEVIHALGRDVGVQLAGDPAAILHFDGHDGICHICILVSLYSIVVQTQRRFFSRMARSISRLASRLATASRLS